MSSDVSSGRSERNGERGGRNRNAANAADQVTKRSVAVVVRGERGVLMVQRPADDEDLPNAWGLPASSLKPGESWDDAVRRTGREKLGVQLGPLRELEQGTAQRTGYTLEMKLFEAGMTGEPTVPQDVPGVTQYQKWKWGSAADLEPAAARGSLCCRLFQQNVSK